MSRRRRRASAPGPGDSPGGGRGERGEREAAGRKAASGEGGERGAAEGKAPSGERGAAQPARGGRRPSQAPRGGAPPGRRPARIPFLAQVGILVAVFAIVTLIAELAGAANLGVSLGIGSIAFAIVLMAVMLRA